MNDENKMNYKIKEFNIGNFQEIRKIYLDSFSKENRFSLLNLLINVVLKRANIYILNIENEIAAFIYSVNNYNERFILYLAVKENYRDIGIGSYLLNWYLSTNSDKEIYLNIDEVDEKYEDYITRKKRLDFYLKNNFYSTNYYAIGSSVGDILSNKKELNMKKYELFDKKISKWFWCKSDKITVKQK